MSRPRMEVVGFAIGEDDLNALRRIAAEDERTIAYVLRATVKALIAIRSKRAA